MKLSGVGHSRRTVLKLAASLMLPTTLSAFLVGCNPKMTATRSAAQRMIGVLNHINKAREIGAIYIDQTPGIRQLSAEQLTEKLLLMLALDPKYISTEILDSLDTRLRKQVRQDFVDENVQIVNGWMLSKTELALCALATTFV
ncbi:MAG: hypothetical protein GXP09_02585 [Gammaproteobacteria bacterium]|nr:hypothetical protein [Gammaproteobacteria bacterium]